MNLGIDLGTFEENVTNITKSGLPIASVVFHESGLVYLSGEGGGEKQMNDDPERVKEGQLAAEKIAEKDKAEATKADDVEKKRADEMEKEDGKVEETKKKEDAKVKDDEDKSEIHMLSNTIVELVKQNNEFKQLLIEQNQKMAEMVGSMGSNNTINSNNTVMEPLRKGNSPSSLLLTALSLIVTNMPTLIPFPVLKIIGL